MAEASCRDAVWQFGNAILHRALILHCRRTLGGTAFLDRIEQAFDSGGTGIDLRSVAVEDIGALRDCVAGLISREPDEIVAELRVSYNPDRVHDQLCAFANYLERTLNDAPRSS